MFLCESGDCMKGFWNDFGGLSIQDTEKIITGISFLATVFVLLYKYLTKDIIDPLIVQYSLGVGGLLVIRKGLSYWKPERYQQNQPFSPTINEQEQQNDKSKY